MEYKENWGVPCGRVRDFFASQSDVESLGGGSFRHGDCLITVKPLPERGSGPFRGKRTSVEMSGPEEETERIHKRFFLRFLSAGG